MPKQCPQCGKVYDDQASYCHREGAELVAVPQAVAPRPAARRWVKWAVVAGVIVVAILGAFFGLRAYLRGGVTVIVENIAVAEQEGSQSEDAKIKDRIVGALKAIFGNSDLLARLRVRNDTAIPVTIISARYTLSLSDREIGSGNWAATEGAPANLPAHGSVALDLPFQLEGKSLLLGVVEALTRTDTALRVDGVVTVALWSYRVNVPFKANYTQASLPLETQPSY